MLKFQVILVICFLLKQHGVSAATTAQSICNKHGKVGLFPNPDNWTCKEYVKCFMNNGAMIGTLYNCPGTTLFSSSVLQCVHGYTCPAAPVTTTTPAPTTTTWAPWTPTWTPWTPTWTPWTPTWTPWTPKWTTPKPCSVPASSSGPLYQLYNPSIKDHFYTNSSVEMARVMTLGYQSLPSPGKITISPSCMCETEVPLLPVYRLYSETATDHFYTTSFQEATTASTTGGYMLQHTEFYCSLRKGFCDATRPLYRFYNSSNTDHFYDTNLTKGEGSTYEEIICYIWPTW